MINSEDVIFDGNVHDELVDLEPWGDIEGGKFVGKLVFREELGKVGNCPVYSFTVESLVDHFLLIHMYDDESFQDQNYDGDAKAMTQCMVSELKAMTARLEAVIAKSEEAARQGGDK